MSSSHVLMQVLYHYDNLIFVANFIKRKQLSLQSYFTLRVQVTEYTTPVYFITTATEHNKTL